MNAPLSRVALLLCSFLTITSLCACGPEDENNATSNNKTAQNNNTGGELTNPLAGDADAAAAGAELFEEQFCQTCHGSDGSASAPANNKALADTAANQDDTFLYNVIAEGVEGTSMAGYKSKLDENQIWQLVTYIRTYAN